MQGAIGIDFGSLYSVIGTLKKHGGL